MLDNGTFNVGYGGGEGWDGCDGYEDESSGVSHCRLVERREGRWILD